MMRNQPLRPLDRREFILAAIATALCAGAAEPKKKFAATIIGHTGRGDYGHGIDMLFTDRDDVELLAIADPDPQGRAKAAQRAKAPRRYENYREMLAKEKPQLVGIGPRWTDQRRDMALAAIEAGAHIYSEKPFAPSLIEADEILAAAAKTGRKIAVAHQMRLAPSILYLKNNVEDGLIGDLVTIDAWGKQDDRRAGGEDMLVLGTHLFDLMRFFAGDPLWCTARVTEKGADITSKSAKKASEEIGPIAGDEISAQFAFAKSAQGSFTSRAKARESIGHWGLLLTGTKGSARILMDIWPTIYWTKSSPWNKETGKAEKWQHIPGDPGVDVPEAQITSLAANRRVVDDWLAAISENRQPICSGQSATAAIEMVMAVYQSAIARKRIEFPLTDRQHPLAK